MLLISQSRAGFSGERPRNALSLVTIFYLSVLSIYVGWSNSRSKPGASPRTFGHPGLSDVQRMSVKGQMGP